MNMGARSIKDDFLEGVRVGRQAPQIFLVLLPSSFKNPTPLKFILPYFSTFDLFALLD